MTRVLIAFPPEQNDTGQWSTAVRVLDGVVRVGDHFCSAYVTAHGMLLDGTLGETSRSPAQGISARVLAIEAYRHELAEAPEGMTARLQLSVEGPVLPREGMTLDTSPA